MRNAASIKKYSDILCRIFNGEDIIVASEFDLSFDGKYTNGFFATGYNKICVIENEVPVFVENISLFEKFHCGEFSGSGILEAFSNSGRKLILRFSMEYIEEFNAIANILNDLLTGNYYIANQELPTNSKVCPNCGNPYVDKSGVCRHCANNLNLLKKLLKLAKPYKKFYICLLILFWVSGAVTVISPAISKHLINDVLTAKDKSSSAMIILIALMFSCTIISWITQLSRAIVSSKASNLLVLDIRNHIYEKIQKMPLSYIEKKKTGDLIQRINNDTQRIQVFIQDILIAAFNDVFLFIAIAIITFTLNVKMALLIYIPMPLVVFLISKIRKSIKGMYMNQWRKMDVLTNRLTEVLNGIKLVKVFGKENDEIEKFKSTAKVVREITCKNEKYVYTVFPLIRFLMSFGSFFVLLYGGSCVLNHTMSLGELVQFSSYGSFLYSKLEWLAMLPRHFTIAMVSSQRVFEVLDEIREENHTENLSTSDISGNINFDNVSFGYKSFRKVLRNISSETRKGEMIGLVGHSGAGKSTYINLVMRLYNPDIGRITLDGEDILKYNEKEYKDILGVVLQETYLFNGTILDNIRYSDPNASIEECIIASKKANIHDFIMSLPDAYNTNVGEKGYKLSGGERQRVAIAQAILSNPKIIILDEATASVDTETESKIQEALRNVVEGKTVFAIAHRLSTLKYADRLFVFEEGRIAESGTHQELIKKNGIYAKLLKAQQEMAIKKVTIDGYKKPEDENNQDYVEDFEYDKD